MAKNKRLYCLRITGPDDLIAAPSALQATDAAEEFNRLYASGEAQAHEDLWPHGAESHKHSLAKYWPEYASLAKAGRKRRLAGD